MKIFKYVISLVYQSTKKGLRMAKKESKKSTKESTPFFTQPFKEKSYGRKGLRKKASIFKRQEQKDEEIITGSLKNKLFATKKKKEKVVIASLKNRSKMDYVLIVIAIVVSLLIFLFLVMLLYSYLKKPQERYLEVGENIETAIVKNESSAEIRLREFNPTNISKIRLIFLGNAEYYYETEDIRQDYVLSASDVGIGSFRSVVKVSAIFRYDLRPAPANTTPSPTQTKPNCTDGKKNGDETGVDCGGSCKACSSAGGGVEGGGECTSTCASLGYECGNWTICRSSKNCGTCETGEQCVSGICQIIPDCNNNSDCNSFDNICSYGICNSTGKCQISYNSTTNLCRASDGGCDVAEYCDGGNATCTGDIFKPDGTTCSLGFCKQGKCAACLTDSNCSADGCNGTEYRDYFCNSTNGCQYNITTKIENLTNNNCNDGIDNNCNGINDSTEANCTSGHVCGNSVIESGEVCDQAQLGGKSCSDFFAYGSGTLKCCSPLNCTKFDLSSCYNKTYTSCNDGDGGQDALQRATVTIFYSSAPGPDCNNSVLLGGNGGTENSTDFCTQERYLTEFYCGSDNLIKSTTVDCGRRDCYYGECTGRLPSLGIWARIRQFFGF
ncbi:hypothetical protein A3K73_01175 [Candidatus Pacearchaeota archaeon RBG_13_36_9]|nr:MAG: hypothetical protein A3K73_01175 [Candidatus Pacearchaeota archaeon RBG_13_36_9]